MNALIHNYIAVNAVCCFSLFILIHASRRNVFFVQTMKKQFAIAAYITILVIAAEIGSVIFEHRIVKSSIPVFAVNMVGFSLSPFIAIILSRAFSVEKGRISAWLCIPVWISLAFVVSSPWTGLVFHVSDGHYLRGPLFGVYIFAYLCSFAVLIVESRKAMKHYQCHTSSTFAMLFAFVFAGTLLQIVFPDAHTSWVCISLGLILYYAYFCELTQTQDILTGLLNRGVYEQYTKTLHETASGSVLMFDLDGFKQINDTYGHQWGDQCLKTIAAILKSSFLHMGQCYRIGGDEFCAICTTTNEQEIKDAIGLFHAKIEAARKSPAVQYALPMVSTGYAIFSNLENGYDAAMKEADAQMYRFKKERRQNLADSLS